MQKWSLFVQYSCGREPNLRKYDSNMYLWCAYSLLGALYCSATLDELKKACKRVCFGCLCAVSMPHLLCLRGINSYFCQIFCFVMAPEYLWPKLDAWNQSYRCGRWVMSAFYWVFCMLCICNACKNGHFSCNIATAASLIYVNMTLTCICDVLIVS
jgi:hypothetical protein